MKKIIWLLIMVLTVSFLDIRPAFAETVKPGFRCGKIFVTFSAARDREEGKKLQFVTRTLRKSHIRNVNWLGNFQGRATLPLVSIKEPEYPAYNLHMQFPKDWSNLIDCLD